MYDANADIKKRSLMRAHEEYLMRVRSAEGHIKDAEDKAKAAEAKLKVAEDKIKDYEYRIASLEAKLELANKNL